MLKFTNRAAELGPSRFDWWPNWRGADVAIIASGPSTKGANLEALRGRFKVIAIKQSFDLCEWADAVYGCDAPWWRHRQGLPKFTGLKMCYRDNALAGCPDIKRIDIDKHGDRLLLDEPAKVGSGGNSGFHALNLVAQFGAKRILLVGFDAQDRSGAHWYGRNNWLMANNPTEQNFKRWMGAFKNAAADLEAMGIEVVNASPLSHVKAFPRRSIEDTLKAWT